jgi:cytochrome P450
MKTNLWSHADVNDPYSIYETMIRESPVYRDEINRVWGVYSYDGCKTVLNNHAFHIPESVGGNELMFNDTVLNIRSRLTRLSNGITHEIARHTALLLFERMKTVEMDSIIKDLLRNDHHEKETDWVGSVGKQLPSTVILKGFGFNDDECWLICHQMGQLVKIMSLTGQADLVNETAKEIYHTIENRLIAAGFYMTIIENLSRKYDISKDDAVAYCVSNLIGLLIQGYDACRGLLSNSLLQLLNDGEFLRGNGIAKERVQKAVIETLRFDPPVHNTRRVAAEDLQVNGYKIAKGEIIIVMLAAANRDPAKFVNPALFDIERANNHEALTFGTGAHACVAKHFSIQLATEALTYSLNLYKNMKLREKEIKYEPLMNVRLPVKMLISLY